MIGGKAPFLCGLTASVRRSRSVTTKRPSVIGRVGRVVEARRAPGPRFSIALPSFRWVSFLF